MKLKNRPKKFSFIFVMLVCTLALFCFPIKTVKADSYMSESLLKWLQETTATDGVHTLTVTGNNGEVVIYNIHLIVLNGNQEITTNTTYGNASDIGTASASAKNMVVVKVNGNYTVHEDVTVAPYSTEYGGPKGFTLFVTGVLTNNGTIDNSHGAKAEGQNVYLWKNDDGTFEYVPTGGGGGGERVYSNNNYSSNGKKGTDGSKRGTGGGGSGRATYGDSGYGVYSGAGAAGTSYSGGSGGGGADHNSYYTDEGSPGEANGGAGGAGLGHRYSDSWQWRGAGGGAGNPGGYAGGSTVYDGRGNITSNRGENGTGGLLTIYGYVINNSNTGKIQANGSNGSDYNSRGGGSSGGGSVNIFSNNTITNNGVIQAKGGDVVGNGGAGGTGTVTTKQINLRHYPEKLDKIIINGNELPNFDPDVFNYTYRLNEYDISATFSLSETFEEANVDGLGTFEMDAGETQEFEIVLKTDPSNPVTYKITVTNPSVDLPNSKLKKIVIENGVYELTNYNPLLYQYDITLLMNEMYLDIDTVAYDPNATVEIIGNSYIQNENGNITIKVSTPGVEDTTIYTITYNKSSIESKYSYTGTYQTFTAPITGEYRIQAWGASGGAGRRNWSTINAGGKGAYTSGYIHLTKNQKLYVFVGNTGTQSGLTNKYTGGAGGFNGGGIGGNDANQDSDPEPGGGGGGASDIRLVLGAWNNFDSLKSRIMVAAGGSGGSWNAGNPGGLYYNNTNGYQFGIGQTGYTGATIGSGGGGGGYYGGYSVQSDGGTTYGGTSYVSGCEGCKSISQNSTSSSITLTNNKVHYSDLEFNRIVMFNGNQSMPNTANNATETGHSGSGYVIIESIDLSKDNYLTTLLTDKGNIYPAFDPTIENYTLLLDVDDTKLKVNARPSSDLATIEGIGEYDIPAGITEIPITVTAESGDERVYTIKVSRPASSEDKVNNITITGLIQDICSAYPGYCLLDQSFDPDIHEYYMTVPAGIRELEFTVDKMHDYQTIVGDGVSKLKVEENVVTIEVTSEDGEHRTTYTYYISRDLTGDNYLDTLIVKPIDEEGTIGNEIDIGFHHLVEEYSFKVNNEVHSLDLEIKTDDPTATYEVVGNENFSVGNNIVDIEVKASNNEIRTYRLNVYRVSNDNPLLSSIEVVDGDNNSYTLSPEFNDVKTKYTVTVDNEIEEVTIIATPQKDTTTVTGDGLKQLSVGRNTYTISSRAENGLTFVYEVVVIRLQNSNNYLSSLVVGEGNIDPSFDKEEPDYKITVDAHIKSLTITATPEVNTSTVSILGNSNFSIGENEVIVRVTAEDGTTRDYTITVTKESSDNNYLSTLSVVGNETEILTNFDKEEPSYEIRVGNEISSVIVSGEKEDSLSTVEGFNTYNLTTGNNEITVKVTSETGIERIYTINIIRDKNTDASLKAINLTSGSINLQTGVYEYTVAVDNDVEEIGIEGIPNVSITQVSGNGTFELEVGIEKTITLTTLAEDEVSTLTYTLKITRKKNDNAYLSELTIDEGIIHDTFNKLNNNYTMTVRNNVTSLTVTALAEMETSSVVISKPETLIVGENEVRITVTAASGDINIYKVIVTRLSEEASKLNLSTLDITHCTLSPAFDSDTYSYTCDVDYEVGYVDINATPTREEYHVVGVVSPDLEVGENIITISVYDELYENHNEYNVTITRKESAETRLKNIRVVNHALNEVFNKDNPNYTLNTSENYIFVTYEKMHEGQNVTVSGNNNLVVGSNTVTVHVVAANGVDTGDYTITVTKSPNPNNYLLSLGVDGYSISPTFIKGRMDYTLEVENEVNSIVVSGIPEESTSSVTGTGMHSLVKGKNVINVTVTSESGVSRVYTIEVTKLGSRNANLSSLSVTGQTISPEFNSNTTSYSLTVPYEVDSVEINAVPEDANALIAGDGVVSLNQGVNDKGIIVTSENGETKTYWIHITRSDPVTSKLKNISVRNYSLSPVFDSDTTDYTVIVDYEVESLDLIIEKLDPQSTYVVEGNSLDVGENTVRVISTSSADSNDKTTYTLNVVRQAYSNTYLSSLTVSEGTLTPVFDKTVLSYEVEVDYEVNQIDIEGVAENNDAVVTGNGIYDLLVGENNIYIKVSLNGITRVYNVKVNRKGSNNANILSITSNLGTVTKVEDTIYSLTVPYNTTEILSSNIIVTPENSGAVVSKQGRLDLSVSQTYNIRVTSEDGEVTKDYVINVILDKSTNNYLSSLVPSVGTLNPGFTKTREDYTIEVLDTTTEIEFTAVLDDSRAEILNNSLVFDLPNYSNTIEIQVKSEKGSIRTYNVVVTKSLTRERTLSNIEVTGIEDVETGYEFEETTYEYSIVVPYEITSVGFNITKKHPSQIVKIYNSNNAVVTSYPLSVGINIYEVRVTNSYNEELTYRYSIERLRNTNNYLRSLKLTSPAIVLENFDRERLEYNVTVPYTYENIGVEAIAEDTANARVTITGTTYLIEGMENEVSIKVKAQNGDIREYIIHVLRIPKSNNLLKTLTVSSGSIYILSPKFTPGTTEYTLEVPSAVDLVGVEGLAMDDNATVEGNGDYNLRIGLNKIQLKVISEDLEERIYKVNITRLSDKNVYLSRLIVNNGTLSPTFNKTTGVYRVDLPYTESALSLNIATEDPNAKYEVLGNSNLKYGENEVRIKVTSSDGSASKIYVLNVVKQGNINNNLADLKIDGETVEGFDPDTIRYTYVVEYATDNVLVEATPEYSTSTVVGTGYKSLVEGTNTINVDVISQSGLRKTYTITVIRKLNTNLMAIVTDRGEVSPTFDKETLNYTLEVENNIKDITVIGVKESSNAEVTGNGKYDLLVGENPISLVVTNGLYSRTYNLVVTRKGSMNTNLKYLTVAESVLDKEFSNSENEYTLYIQDDITSLSLSYEPEDETSTVEVIGNGNFDEANETVTLRVTSTGKQVRDIIIHVIREPESTFSNKLLDLSVDKGTMSPRFEEDTQEYTVTVPSNTKEITISATKRGNQVVEGVGTKPITKTREEFKVSVTSKDGKTRVYTLIVYKQAGTDARLSKLGFNEGYITPTFNKNVYNYVLTAASDTKIVTIKEIETVDENATYQIYGTLLSGSTGTIRIEVTAADGVTKKTYIVSVLLEKSNNAYLSSITSNIGILSPDFNKETQSYEINVENEVSDIIIDAVAESDKATVTGNGKYSLRTGSNTINILVTAEAGNVRTYTIIVNRALSRNVDLKDLYVRGYEITPTFDKDTVSYTLEVENDVTYVDIDGELADSLSSVIGFGRHDLEVGENKINVVVTAEAGNTKIYQVSITRKDKLSSKIRDLVVKEGTLSPTFGSEQLEYTISIPNEYKKITPVITLEDPNATYNIIGNSNFAVGNNVVTIEVTSSDNKETSVYTLNVIRNISSNNYLSSLKVSEGTLSPAFDKTVGYYEVEVENEVERIVISGTPEVTSTFIAGLGTYDLDVGENMIIVRTMSESGIPRSYQIKVKRKGNNSNYLTTLSVQEGNLYPAFDREEPNYTVTVPAGTREVHVEGTLESETASVTGLGTHTITAGENTIDVVVTSESGNVRTYTIKVIRPKSSNTNISSFIPDSGVLSPAFTNDNDNYTLNVGRDVNVINIEVVPESIDAKVGGNKNITINGNSKETTITVLAEDNTLREIKVNIVKAISIEDITINSKDILIVLGEEYELDITPTPASETPTYVLEPEQNIVSVSGKKITGLIVGTTKITVKVSENALIEKEVQVTVTSDKIQSSEYEVKDKTDRIVIGAEEGITIREFKDNLLNDSRTIKIYDGDTLLSESDTVRTGLTIKLENNSVVHDEAILIVRGDVDGDGIIDVTDESLVLEDILGLNPIVGYGRYAADVLEDEILDVSDDSNILDYILNLLNTLN